MGNRIMYVLGKRERWNWKKMSKMNESHGGDKVFENFTGDGGRHKICFKMAKVGLDSVPNTCSSRQGNRRLKSIWIQYIHVLKNTNNRVS